MFALATFPVVFLWAQNPDDQIDLGTVLQPLALIWATTLVVFALLRSALRDVLRAGFVTSMLLILFFSFGHIRNVAGSSAGGLTDGQLFLATGLLLLVGGWLALRAGPFAPGATRILNAVALVLVLMNVTTIVVGAEAVAVPHARFSLPAIDPGDAHPGRDVFYMIFDRYANIRTLRELYRFDNSPFHRFLRSEGFFVAEDSLANYQKTSHSLASSLNMNYLDEMAAIEGVDSSDWGPVLGSLSGSNVAAGFQQLGYRYEHVGSWWDPTRRDITADQSHDPFGVSEFSGVLLRTTMWPTLAARLGLDVSFERRQYERALFQFDTLEEIARNPEATFTFAHFLLPHPDYVFHADGRFMSARDVERLGRPRAYLEQLRYTNKRIRLLVQTLLSGPSATDPIVVIQSDEGPTPAAVEADESQFDWWGASDIDLGQKLRILNALYLPGDGEQPYSTMSPVNTFRLIFSRYFGADLGLLPDRTFVYKDASHPYLFTEVTDGLRG